MGANTASKVTASTMAAKDGTPAAKEGVAEAEEGREAARRRREGQLRGEDARDHVGKARERRGTFFFAPHSQCILGRVAGAIPR